VCTQDAAHATTQHTLLERWTLRGNPLAPSSPLSSPHHHHIPFATPDSPNTPTHIPHSASSSSTNRHEDQIAEFGKYLSSLMDGEPPSPSSSALHDSPNLDLRESHENIGEGTSHPLLFVSPSLRLYLDLYVSRYLYSLFIVVYSLFIHCSFIIYSLFIHYLFIVYS
jgi:hypothetical protein